MALAVVQPVGQSVGRNVVHAVGLEVVRAVVLAVAKAVVLAVGEEIQMIMLSSLLAMTIPDVDILATVLTLEDNTTRGMTAINNVVYNRAKENKKNIRKVLLKKYQFTCLNPHTVQKKSLRDLVKKAKSRSNWNVAKSIAENTYKGKVHTLVAGATHYHVYRGKIKCSPTWTHPSLGGKNKKCKIVAFIGNHVYLKNVD